MRFATRCFASSRISRRAGSPRRRTWTRERAPRTCSRWCARRTAARRRRGPKTVKTIRERSDGASTRSSRTSSRRTRSRWTRRWSPCYARTTSPGWRRRARRGTPPARLRPPRRFRTKTPPTRTKPSPRWRGRAGPRFFPTRRRSLWWRSRSETCVRSSRKRTRDAPSSTRSAPSSVASRRARSRRARTRTSARPSPVCWTSSRRRAQAGLPRVPVPPRTLDPYARTRCLSRVTTRSCWRRASPRAGTTPRCGDARTCARPGTARGGRSPSSRAWRAASGAS